MKEKHSLYFFVYSIFLYAEISSTSIETSHFWVLANRGGGGREREKKIVPSLKSLKYFNNHY